MRRAHLPGLIPASFMIGGCAIFLSVIGMLISQQTGTARQIRSSIRHTHDLLADAGDMNNLIRDAERGQRGYLLTGSSEYLAPYQAALQHLPPLYEHFLQMVAGNGREQQHLAALMSLMRLKLAELEQTIQLRTTSGEEAAKQVVMTDLGRRLMTQITAELDTLVAEADQNLMERDAAVERAEAKMRQLTLGASVLAVLFLSLAALMLRRGAVQRREADREKDQQRQELEQSNTDLEQFASIASHDLQAPLRAISHLAGWIDQDVRPTASPDTLDNLKLLQDRVGRMQMLLDGLLGYARLGRANTAVELVDVTEVVRNIVAMRAPPAGFIVACQGTMPLLRTHLTPIQVVLENLIANGVKHHDRATGFITVAMQLTDGMAEFRVSDDGPGIAPQFHDRIFGMFQTLASRDQVEASGIGLAIVKRMVLSHGGQIRVESNPPARGTTFVFTWKELVGDDVSVALPALGRGCDHVTAIAAVSTG